MPAPTSRTLASLLVAAVGRAGSGRAASTSAAGAAATAASGGGALDVINARMRPAGVKASKLRESGRTPGTVTGLPGNTYAHLTLASPDVAALVRRHGRRGLAARQVDLRVRVGGSSEGSPPPPNPAEASALAAVAEGASGGATLTPATPLTVRALPHQIHVNAATGAVENVNFLALPAGKGVSASVPISVVGADLAPGVKRGGFLNLIRRAVRVTAPDRDALPAQVEVDASGLELGQRVACRDLALPPGASLAEPHPELPVLKVAGRQARE